jgi:L-threonylcarbamoyladenylate synthase
MKSSKLKLFVIVFIAVAVVCVRHIHCSLNTFHLPSYAKEDITHIIDDKNASDSDMEFVFEQTGVCPQIARELIKRAGVPIAAPSANISGSPSPTNAAHVIDDMQGRVDVIIDGGDSEIGVESTIVKIDGDGSLTLLRPGKITVEELSEVCADVKIADAVIDKLKSGEVALSPGMKYRHYAPSAPVYLVEGDTEKVGNYLLARTELGKKIAVIAYSDDCAYLKEKIPELSIYEFGAREDELTQAHALFDILREADKQSYDEIYAPLPKKSGVGLALYNRMIRAAAHNIIRL